MAGELEIVFLGSDPVALPLLDWLAGEGRKAGRVTAVFTQPDRPAGRGREIRPNAIKAWALDRGLPVFQPEKLGSTEREALTRLAPDLSLVMAYGHILRDDFIAVPRLGTLNLHASLLPRHRGASPIQAAVASGDRESGVTLMRIVRRLDAGPTAGVERVPIGRLDTAAEVEARIARACVPLMARSLPPLIRGELRFSDQDEARATYCRKLSKDDGALDFAAPAAELAARVNGLFPWPGCAAQVGDEVLRIGLADVAQAGSVPSPAGTVVGADPEGLLVAAGDGLLRLRRLQRAGGRMLPAGEFLRGFPVHPGATLRSRPMRPLVETGPR